MPPADANAIQAFTNLPPRTASKITVDGPEHEVCWLWTGAFTEAATRHKVYNPAPDKERSTWGCLRNMRGVPKVSVPGRRDAVPAHRAIYAAHHGVAYEDVPKLTRCTNDRCVSPHHNLAQERPEAPLTAVPASEAPCEVWDALRRVRPASFIGTAIAEEECNLPAGSITPEIWLEYVHWDEANPDPNDG